MGMAAGQARLLSITSRLSDNELRAQIINNNKMRLATESSQASEAYISALNQAQMMFTNYDKNNNASYEKLSFNSLTAYNAYNNQYALTNSGGQVLLSEKDARIYNESTDVNSFLAAYGIEYTTTYFDQFDQVFPTGFPMNWYNSEGQVEGFIVEDGTPPTYLTFTSEQLKAMYEGGELDIPKIGNIVRNYSEDMNAYDFTAASETMYNYEKCLTNYQESYSNYLELISQAEQGQLLTMLNESFGTSDKTLSEILGMLTGSTGNEGDFQKLLNLIWSPDFENLLADDPTGETDAYLNKLRLLLTGYKQGNDIATVGEEFLLGTTTLGEGGSIAKLVGGTATTAPTGIQYVTGYAEDGTPNAWGPVINFPSNITFDDNGNVVPSTNTNDPTLSLIHDSSTPPNYQVIVTRKMSDDELKDAAIAIVKELSRVISNIWDADSEVWQTNDITKEAYQTYLKHAKELADSIYGGSDSIITATTSGDPPVTVYAIAGTGEELEHNKTIVKNLGDIVYLYNNYDPTNPFTDDFKQVFCNLILDRIMDTYGEPKYTWIDKNNPNENGEAKAKWYKNLYALIEKNGYKTLLDGMASSTEWIQFAFENGLVQLKQIDEHNAWNNIIYTNCADITEQTDDKAIAIAEAEYNAAMNRIENKDKRYDLELKNIDTEHNSLQVEYDSIKTAIDKNIERNFKLYS